MATHPRVSPTSNTLNTIKTRLNCHRRACLPAAKHMPSLSAASLHNSQLCGSLHCRTVVCTTPRAYACLHHVLLETAALRAKPLPSICLKRAEAFLREALRPAYLGLLLRCPTAIRSLVATSAVAQPNAKSSIRNNTPSWFALLNAPARTPCWLHVPNATQTPLCGTNISHTIPCTLRMHLSERTSADRVTTSREPKLPCAPFWAHACGTRRNTPRTGRTVETAKTCGSSPPPGRTSLTR